MEFDLSWVLIGLPLAFGLGWLASRWDLRQVREDNRRAPKAYFKGLNYLLNEQQDQAIDAFIEAVQNDPDTTELHFALGNLFRRRGEYNRAVRVHEHLLARADLSRSDRERAQHALALDFLKAGLLDRAEEALRRLEGSAFEAQARLALLAIYERSRDWMQAGLIAQRMQQAQQGDFSSRLAHYLCEQAASQASAGAIEPAQSLLQQAQSTAPQAARPYIDLAQLLHGHGQSPAAWAHIQTLASTAPQALPLVAGLVLDISHSAQQTSAAGQLLLQHYQTQPSLDVLDALIALHTAASPQDPNAQHAAPSQACDWYIRHLEQEPSLVVASKWLASQCLTQQPQQPLLQRALDQATKPLLRYRCAACGFEARQHFWQCPGCQSWDSYPARRVEEL